MTPIIHHCSQNSPEWLSLRLGRVTASELSSIVTPDFKIRKAKSGAGYSEGFWTYVYEKVAEKFRGQLNPGFSSFATDQGAMREDEAIPWYELTHDVEVARVGFIEHESGLFGASPDGLIQWTTGSATIDPSPLMSIHFSGGLEIKCPANPAIHLRYLDEGVVPPHHFAQVHGGMYASGLDSWVFMSYCPTMPKLIVEVRRDEEIQEKIDAALMSFYVEFNLTLERLKEANEKQYAV